MGLAPDITRLPLVRSLADPMFGCSVSEVRSNFLYHLEYAGQRTRDFHVKVFEYPELEKADADLTFPSYTAQPPKHIENTRRISAVQGSRLDLSLKLNKPVVAARLLGVGPSPAPISLDLDPQKPAAKLQQFLLTSNRTFRLVLTDAEGRTNKVPAQFVFEALTNRVPEIQLARPRGDLRPSPLEEIPFEGTVWDDFGVSAYGLGYAVAGQETKFMELGRSVPAKEKRPFQYLLRLEDLGLQPDQLISWFVWTDDFGPDGALRRSTSDIFFGEVRPFEEVFREGQGMEGESAGGAGDSSQEPGQPSRLSELQKQIISATWKLQRQRNPATPPPAPANSPPRDRQSSHPVPALTSGSWFGQVSPAPARSPRPRRSAAPRDSASASAAADDLTVVSESQAQVLEEAKAAAEAQRDPRSAALWRSAIQEMESALARLRSASNSPPALKEALAAEQNAYQNLLRLQEHEYQVSRSRSRSSNSSGRNQQMQRQLDELDLDQSPDQYENQRQAQSQPNSERREQLQVMNRLQELARRQQDLNDRLKELQTALQQARSEEERAEIRRRLKRLSDDEQQMLSDVDELRQRLDRPENQSRMAEQRQQLDQAREDLRKAAEAASQEANSQSSQSSQALASGTRAQRQLQQMRDQMRQQNSNQFADDMRDLRNQARELARQQKEILQKIQATDPSESKSLSGSGRRTEAFDQLARQKGLITNLVDRATQLSQQSESSEPLLSSELYETLRKFAQESGKNLKETEDDLLSRGRMTRSLYDHLRSSSDPDAAKLEDVTTEMLRLGFDPLANQAAERARAPIDNFKNGVERAAESVLGDDTEALKLAQQELDRLTDQVQQEINRAQTNGSSTNSSGLASGVSASPGNSNALTRTNELSAQTASAESSTAEPGQRQQTGAPGDNSQQRGQSSGNKPGNQDAPNQTAQSQTGDPQSAGGPNQPGPGQRDGQRRDGGAVAAGGGGGGGARNWNWDRWFNNDAWRQYGPLTGEDFTSWSDRLRDVEEMLEQPDLRNDVASARERARLLRQEFKRDGKKPDWAVVRSLVMKPLAEVRDRITEELARRESRQALVPIDRDPVPDRYSDLVRRYYENLGKASDTW